MIPVSLVILQQNVFDIKIVRISPTVVFVAFVINEEVTWNLVGITNSVYAIVTI